MVLGNKDVYKDNSLKFRKESSSTRENMVISVKSPAPSSASGNDIFDMNASKIQRIFREHAKKRKNVPIKHFFDKNIEKGYSTSRTFNPSRPQIDFDDITDQIVEISPGKFYKGEWKDKKRNGFGTLSWEGNVFQGIWVDDRANGFGIMRRNDGDYYSGLWEDDHMHGIGDYRNKISGSSYEGFFEYDQECNFGVEKWADGSCFEGEYDKNEKSGIGILIFGDGSRYQGQMLGNDITGIGEFVYNDGNSYQGQWSQNKMHGYGIYTWSNGSAYQGSFKDNVREGFGILFSSNKVYIGNWKNSKLEGEGILVKNGSARKYIFNGFKKVKELPESYDMPFDSVVSQVLSS